MNEDLPQPNIEVLERVGDDWFDPREGYYYRNSGSTNAIDMFDGPPDDEGGAGVREPRRPRPRAPGGAAVVAVPIHM